MHPAPRLAFTLLGVGVGLAARLGNRVSRTLFGESDLEYLRRKHSELIERNWTDGNW